MRISSIDVGSNAIRMVIAEIDPASQAPNQWTVIKKFRAPLRLGSDVFTSSKISGEALKKLVLIFKKMARLNRKYRAKKVLCVATSAMRDAKNGRSVVRTLKIETGINVQVIDGVKEARYIQESVIRSQVVNFSNTLFIDIGGGSVELTAYREAVVAASQSYPLGAVRLMDKMRGGGFDLETETLKYLRRFSQKIPRIDFKNAIGTGGNFDALSKLKLSLLKKAPQTNLSLAEIEEIFTRWKKLSGATKLAIGMRKDRIDILDIALPLIVIILKHFGIQRLKIPNTGLKEGLIHSVLG